MGWRGHFKAEEAGRIEGAESAALFLMVKALIRLKSAVISSAPQPKK